MGDGRDRVGTDVTAIFVLSAINLFNIYPFKVAIINISPEHKIVNDKYFCFLDFHRGGRT